MKKSEKENMCEEYAKHRLIEKTYIKIKKECDPLFVDSNKKYNDCIKQTIMDVATHKNISFFNIYTECMASNSKEIDIQHSEQITKKI